MIRLRAFALPIVVSLVAACSSSGDGAIESAPSNVDAGGARADAAVFDAGAAVLDAGSTAPDASVTDAGAPAVDAGVRDAGPSCNTLAFGQPECIYIQIPTSQMLPLTGGAIVDGTYDLVAVETTASISASYTVRSTWRFEGTTLQQVDQLRTTALGPLTVRTGSIAVSGSTITRTYTCGSSDPAPATLTYDSALVRGVQTVRVQSGTGRFTFEKRP